MFKLGETFNSVFTLSKEVYNGFINIFKDKNPMHVDSIFAQNYGYSQFVMHGNILNGFISYFVGEQLPVKEVVILSQDIKFKSPVFLDDILQFNAKIVEIYDSVNVINFKFNFINQKNIKVAEGNIQIKKFI